MTWNGKLSSYFIWSHLDESGALMDTAPLPNNVKTTKVFFFWSYIIHLTCFLDLTKLKISSSVVGDHETQVLKYWRNNSMK